LFLDRLPPEVLDLIFKFVISEYWRNTDTAVFSLDDLATTLFQAESSTQTKRWSPLNPARVHKKTFRAALSQVRPATFIDVPREIFDLQALPRKLKAGIRLLETMSNLQMTVLIRGNEGNAFDIKENRSSIDYAIKNLKELFNASTALQHLHIHVTIVFGTPRRGGYQDMRIRPPHVFRKEERPYIHLSLVRIINAVRETTVKRVDISFNARDFRQDPWEAGEEEASTVAEAMIRRCRDDDYVWRVKGGCPADTIEVTNNHTNEIEVHRADSPEAYWFRLGNPPNVSYKAGGSIRRHQLPRISEFRGSYHLLQ
jgi:hypothetical protein